MLIKELAYKPKIETDCIKLMLNLSDDEKTIYDLALKDKSIVEIASKTLMSESTVSRRLKSIRIKLDNLTRN